MARQGQSTRYPFKRASRAVGAHVAKMKLDTQKGVLLVINLVDKGAAGTLTVKLRTPDPSDAAGTGPDITGAVTAALAANGKSLLLVYPGVAEVANSKVSYALPDSIEVVATVAGNAVEFAVSAYAIP